MIDRTRLFLCSTLLVALPLINACGTIGSHRAGTNVIGVNYHEGEYRFELRDPTNPKNRVTGDLVDSFSAGGIGCCYQLPRQWRPGLKVQIHTTTYYLPPPPQNDIKNLERISGVTEVEVPPYPEDKLNDLWVVRNPDGSFGVVPSRYQPNHPDWPGAIKGGPVPTVEYRRKRADVHIELARGTVRLYEGLLRDLRANPQEAAKRSYDYRVNDLSKYYIKGEPPRPTGDYAKFKAEAEFLESFSGSSDPKFIDWLRARYENALAAAQLNLRRLQDSRP